MPVRFLIVTASDVIPSPFAPWYASAFTVRTTPSDKNVASSFVAGLFAVQSLCRFSSSSSGSVYSHLLRHGIPRTLRL